MKILLFYTVLAALIVLYMVKAPFKEVKDPEFDPWDDGEAPVQGGVVEEIKEVA